MVGYALGLVKGWKLWAALALLSVLAAMVYSYNNAIADAVREKERANAWHKTSLSWKSAYERSESLREQEAGQAVSSANREREQCNQRVADSLASSQRIRSVVRVQEINVPGVCSSAIISSNELRDALGAK